MYKKFNQSIKLIKTDYDKVSKVEFQEKDWTTQGRKITSNIQNFQNIMNELISGIQSIKDNALERQHEEHIQIIEDGIEKAKKVTVKQIQEINEKTRYFNSNFEMNEAQAQNEENQQHQEMIQDLVNDKEYLEKRREDLQNIHKTAAELKDVTNQMAQDVNQQGAMLEEIEANVIEANDNAQKAHQEIKKANEMSKGNSKRMCCFIIIIVVAVGAITAILLSVFLKK